MKRKEVPTFGPLAGVKVLGFVNSLAGPYACSRLADYGADVIWIENPKNPDMFRPMKWIAEVEHRNRRSICLDVPDPASREAFGALLKEADIYIDAFRGGQMDKWGLSDDVLWSFNPSLVIVHISGYGQTGLPEYVDKPSYDPVAQGFSGWLIQNGFPDRKPCPVMPGTGDYLTGLFTAFAAVCALYRAKTTGEGESVDLAQYEIMVQAMGGMNSSYINGFDYIPGRWGSGAGITMYDAYTCKDGIDVYMCVQGTNTLAKAIRFLGLEDKVTLVPYMLKDSPDGQMIEDAINKFCAEHTSAEVEKALNDSNIPCGPILDMDTSRANPQYKAREVYTEWQNESGETIEGVNIFPLMTRHPCKIWRGLMPRGADSDDILTDAGLTDEQIEKLYASGVLINDSKITHATKYGLHSEFGTLLKHPDTAAIMKTYAKPLTENRNMVSFFASKSMKEIFDFMGDAYPEAAKNALAAALEAIR